MEPKPIKCDTFRAVFGTAGIIEQGKFNLAHHEQECPMCAEFAEEKRKDSAVPEITCERFWELRVLRMETFNLEDDAYWRHYKKCSSCKTRLQEEAQKLVAHIFRDEIFTQ